MRILPVAFGTLLCLAIVGFLATFSLEASFSMRSTLAQLVTTDQNSQQGRRLVGAPVRLVDLPPTTILAKGSGDVAAIVDADALNALPHRVLRFDEVQRFGQIVRIGCVIAAVLSALGISWFGPRRRGPWFEPVEP